MPNVVNHIEVLQLVAIQ